MRKGLKIIGISILSILIIGVIGAIIVNKTFMQVKSIRIDNNLLVLEGGGGNSIILTSDDGSQILVVDTKISGVGKHLASQGKAANVTIINTHLHLDHTGGNNRIQNATLIAGAYSQEQWKSLAKTSRFPDKLIQIGQDTILNFGNEVVHIRNMGNAHSWNDVIVYLENRKFLVTGDLVFNHNHPALYVKCGSNTSSWIATLDSLISNYDVSKVLPGHGELSDKNALLDMKDYFVTIKTAIGNSEKLEAARKKYRAYHSIPMMTSFDKTVSFMQKEQKGD